MGRRNDRRILYTPQYVQGFANALREARADLDDMHCKHLRQMAELRRELDAAVADLNELRALVFARNRADAELVALHREAAIQRATRAERNPTQPLQ